MASPTVFRTLSRLLYPLLVPKIDVRGAEHLPTNGGYILASNHVDWLDGFFIAAAVGQARQTPVHFLTASNNYWWTTMTIQIPADRGETIDAAVRHLQQGDVICNFPEGQRNDTDHLLPGKTGTVRMAALAGVPVIPLGITCRSWPNMGQSVWKLFTTKHRTTIEFGPALRFPTDGEKQLSSDWLRQETDRLMSAIAPLCHK